MSGNEIDWRTQTSVPNALCYYVSSVQLPDRDTPIGFCIVYRAHPIPSERYTLVISSRTANGFDKDTLHISQHATQKSASGAANEWLREARNAQ